MKTLGSISLLGLLGVFWLACFGLICIFLFLATVGIISYVLLKIIAGIIITIPFIASIVIIILFLKHIFTKKK